ncbi:FG-GAP-like repeat-containing protein [Limnoglobus roseus]|uniref:TIGR03118 family protein n=1 Tax=Limnoglobus roseus TaxID=2598579 RepID=A0A5C1ALI0_9BACT|nr:FG-GAP-like repeat-containing protein [Limnoglobus roseus]QEL20259.1 TIGR03118 family protein [Limnoglobus roseus]
MSKPQLLALEDRSTPAAVGGLDLTFNGTGLADVPFDLAAAKADLGAAIAVQKDGKIVVVGSAQTGAADIDFAVARLNPDGTLDTTFGSNGIRAFGFDLGGSNIDRATSVAIDSQGRIVVAGYAQTDAANDYDFAVIRVTSTGDLDSTFDTDGRQTVAFDIAGGTQEDKTAGVAIDSQGRIVLAGTVAQATAGDTDFGVVRLTTAGALDKTFGTGGRQTIAFDLGGANADSASGVVIDSGDRVIVAGSVQISNFGDFDFGVARLTAAGALDQTFDGDGRASVEFDLGGSNADTAAAVALGNGEKIVVVGSVVVGTAGDVDIGVARFNTDGSLDTTFGDSGKLSLGFDLGGTKQDKAAGVTINRLTGDIVVAATVDSATAGDTDIGVARLTTDGSLDPSFSADGRAVASFDRGGANADTAAGVTQDARGRILVVGSIDTATANDRDFGVARLTATTGLANDLLVGGTADGQAINYVPAGSGFAKSGGAAGADLTASVRPVVADLNGDGVPDQILGAAPGGGSRVRIQLGGVVQGDVVLTPSPIDFNAFEGNFTGGVFIAAGDIDGDGRDEFVVSPDVGGGPRASIYSLNDDRTLTKKADFFGIDDPNFRGGARVALGDINGDGRADLVVGAGFLGGPRVALYNGATLFTPDANGVRQKLIGDFFAFPGPDAQTLRNGVFVTIGDLDGDGFGDVIFGGGPGGGPRVFALSGQTLTAKQLDAAYAKPVANFFVANDANSRGGVRVTVKDIDGDDRADLVTASGDNLPSRVRVYRGSTVPQANGVEPPLLQEFDPFGVTLANGVFVG